MLRFLPSGLASPSDSLVIAFDHPVAPKLDRSVDPAGVVRVEPLVRTAAYWRDPSTIVVRFAEPLSFGARYSVRIAPTLQSADGSRLAAGQERELRVRKPGLLRFLPSGGQQNPDALQRPWMVYEAPVPLGALAARFVTQGSNSCPAGNTIRLRADSIRPILASDPREVQDTGFDRDRRLDTLRRVVHFTAEAPIPEGCFVTAWVSSEPGGAQRESGTYLMPARFAVRAAACSTSPCEHGNLVVSFTHPVRRSEVEAHVRVNGARASLFDTGPRDQFASTWRLQQVIVPGREVTISFDGTMVDVLGRPLGADVRRVVKAIHLIPAVEFVAGPVIIPRDGGTLFAVRHTNTDSIVVVIGRPADSLRAELLRSPRYGYQESQPRMQPDSIVRVVATRGPMDSAATFLVPASWLPPAWRDEPMLLFHARPRHLASTQRIGWYAPLSVILRTTLAAHVLRGQGTLDVWVTSLREAGPVAGARLRFLDRGSRELAVGTTDQQGRGRLRFVAPSAEGWESDALLEVSSAGERLLVALAASGSRARAPEDDETQHAYRRSSGGDLPDGRGLHGVAFADRGIYRPGERIHFKGIVRTSRPGADYATPAGDSVRWTLSMVGDDFAPQRIGRTATVLSAFGTADTRFDLPRTAALGDYRATLAYRSGASWRVAAETQVRVAEYRPVEFEVALDADTSVMLFAGDTARVRTTARYLFGMPMDGGALQWSARFEDRDYWSVVPRPPALDGFSVGRTGWRTGYYSSRLPNPEPESGTAKLASDGTALISAPIRQISSTSTLVVSAAVTDANRQTVTSERRLTVHAADAYVGVRVAPWRWVRSVGDSVALELLVVRANGAHRPGTPITLRAVRYEWTTGGYREDTVWRSSVVSTDGVVRATFVPTRPGSYEVLASASDERGRVATTGYDLWVAGAWAGSYGTNPITITMDRESYAPGDTAVAVIESTGDRKAWITLSTSMPLVERQVELRRGSNVVRVPVPRAAMPLARLGVIALKPMADGRDTSWSYFTNTERWITVVPSSRALDVRVSPERLRYVPGDTVTLRVSVRDAAGRGRRAEATLWAVDQGVAALTGLEKPELLEPLLGGVDVVSTTSTLTAPVLGSFTGPWPRFLQVRIRGMSSSAYLEQVVVTGYGESRAMHVPGSVLRSVFATTPFWNGSVVTDSAGEATTRFVLPHNVTTFRLFSAAITAGTEGGSGDTSLVTSRPLLVRAALPRMVRQGDTLLAGGVITQDALGRTPVRLAIDARGIDVTGPRMRNDTLDGRRASELRFPMRVKANDSVSVTLLAEGGGHADAIRSTLPVSPPGHPRAHVVMGTLEGRSDVTLPRIDGMDSVRSRVTLQLGVSPLGIVRQLHHALRIYPYFCTEQITSAARALLARRSLERAIDGVSELTSSDREQLERAVTILVSRQRHDGSIGYWSSTDWSSPWLTSYAMSMLLDAREAGIQVPSTTIVRAMAYLSGARAREVVSQGAVARDTSAHDLLAAIRVLQRARLSDSLLEQSLRARASTLGFVDRLDYAMLLATRGDSTAAREIVRTAWRAAQVEGRLVRLDDSARSGQWLFRSSVRPAATLFAATAVLEPRHPHLGALFESIVQQGRSASRWQWNTIEQAEVADAIVAARAIFGLGDARSVSVRSPGGALLATSQFKSGRTDSASFSLAALGPPSGVSAPQLALESDSRAPIYYAATLLEMPRARPVRADDEGIGVERWYESYATGKPLTSVQEGELVRVRLRVIIPRDREFVAITDPLPAGLEAVDLSLRTSSTLAPFSGAPRRNDRSADDAPPDGRWMYGTWDSGWWTPWDHKEIRDDRVHWFARQLWKGTFEISYVARATTAGNFVRPPAYAEEMYNPAVRGRSDGGWFAVTSRP